MSHVTHWSCDHVILKGFISIFAKTMATNFIKVWLELSWTQLSRSHVTDLSCHVITLYSYKGASPISQRQQPPNLVGVWISVKGPHLLFQITCRWSDHIVFEKRHVSTNARPQTSAGDIKHGKTHKSKVFLLFKRY